VSTVLLEIFAHSPILQEEETDGKTLLLDESADSRH